MPNPAAFPGGYGGRGGGGGGGASSSSADVKPKLGVRVGAQVRVKGLALNLITRIYEVIIL